MEDSEKKRIYGLIQLSLKTLETTKFQITSHSAYYAVDGTSGIRFTAKIQTACKTGHGSVERGTAGVQKRTQNSKDRYSKKTGFRA